jgi:dolichol kinase
MQVIILGIGDTAASVCGTYFGKTKWISNAKVGKTIEGTIAGWLFSSMCALAFMACCEFI